MHAHAVLPITTARDETDECDACGTSVPFDEARRAETMGGLDPTAWQTLCCPTCGARLKTVFVGD